MPSSRRMRVTGLVAVLTVCIIFYITNGARSTHNSAFYTRTVTAIQDREAAEARKHVFAEEKERLDRQQRIQREHEAALSGAVPQATRPGPAGPQQKPIVPDTASKSGSGGKSVAGRKMMSDGKVVHGALPKDSDDGVARVGNIGPQSSHAVVGDGELSEEERKVQDAMNEFLRKGPILIFSKSYCPFSKKAKVSIHHGFSRVIWQLINTAQHILLDLYDISPPPYVVELDQHELGPELQSTLKRTTGRSTVPNILINGRSIGGGDDIQALDEEDKLISTVSSMGGKRIMKVQRRPEDEDRKKTEMRFKA